MKIGSWQFLLPPEPYGDISGETFMVMYPIIRAPRFGIIVRHLLKRNVEAHLHQHAFAFLTFIIKGGYVEQRDDGEGVYLSKHRRFTFNWIPQTTAHRIVKMTGDTWTLALHMKWRVGHAGMIVGDEVVPILDYYREHRVRT